MRTLYKARLQEVINMNNPDPDKELYCIDLYFGTRKSSIMRFPIIFNGLENAQPVFQELLEYGGKSESELKEVGEKLYEKYKHLDVRNSNQA